MFSIPGLPAKRRSGPVQGFAGGKPGRMQLPVLEKHRHLAAKIRSFAAFRIRHKDFLAARMPAEVKNSDAVSEFWPLKNVKISSSVAPDKISSSHKPASSARRNNCFMLFDSLERLRRCPALPGSSLAKAWHQGKAKTLNNSIETQGKHNSDL